MGGVNLAICLCEHDQGEIILILTVLRKRYGIEVKWINVIDLRTVNVLTVEGNQKD